MNRRPELSSDRGISGSGRCEELQALRKGPYLTGILGAFAMIAGLGTAQQPPDTLSFQPSTDRAVLAGPKSGVTRLAPDASRHDFHLRADEREVIRQVLDAYGIRAAIDESVVARIIPFDTSGADFEEAVNMLEPATHTFLVPLDAHQVLVAADTKENRMRFEEQVTQTFSFPGVTRNELNDLQSIAREVLGVQQVAMDPGRNTVTMRAPGEELKTWQGASTELVAAQSEIQLDVGIYEIDESVERDAGMILPNSATLFNLQSEVNSILANNSSLVQEIISSGLASAGDWEKIIAILISSGALSGTVFNSPFLVFGGGLTETGVEWNSTAANMLLNSSSVKSIQQIQLRVANGEEATIRSGERYPIMTGSFSNSTSAVSSASQTTPQIQYADLGLTLKVKPEIAGSADVTLRLDMKVDSLAGATLDNIPVLSNRQYVGTVSAPPGESALLVGAMSRQDSNEITGIPAPGVWGETNRQSTNNVVELVILITPHIVRLAHQEAEGPMRFVSVH